MKAFIAPIYIQTNALSLEKIAFGLLGVADQAVYFHTSDHKILVAEQLLGESVIKLVRSSLLAIRQTVARQNKEVKAAGDKLFSPTSSVFNQSYISSLSQYSNGLIQFGAILPVAGGLTRSEFATMFEKFVGEPFTPSPSGRGAFARLVKEKLNIPDLNKKADINYTLKPNKLKVKGLLKPTNITLLTAHNALFVFQQIDFANTENVLANNLYEYEAVADALNEYSEKIFKQAGTFKIIAEMPPAQTAQRKQYDTIRDFKKDIFSFLTPDQLAEQARLIASNGHKKASVFLEEGEQSSLEV
jgi:hypothetical protein